MFGYLVEEFGGPEVMVWQELPDPVPGAGEVLVDVHATGINFAETRMRAGTYSGQPLPFVMGMEGAIGAKTVTYDFHRLMQDATKLSTSAFGNAIITHMS